MDELVPRWRGEKDLRGLWICLAHLAGTLKIDFKDDGAIVRNRLLNGFAWGAIPVAVVDDGPLQQPVTVDKLVELRRGDEVVIDAVALSGARWTGRHRPRDDDLGVTTQQRADYGSLADGCWP